MVVEEEILRVESRAEFSEDFRNEMEHEAIGVLAVS